MLSGQFTHDASCCLKFLNFCEDQHCSGFPCRGAKDCEEGPEDSEIKREIGCQDSILSIVVS